MLKIPYNRLHVRGEILFAARSGRIHSFSLSDGKHISTWKHPDEKTVQGDSELPPAKRQRHDDDDDDDDDEEEKVEKEQKEQEEKEEKDKDENKSPQPQTKKVKDKAQTKQKSKSGHPVARVPDRAIVTQLTSSIDGRYVVAVSGHDKKIWVFHHDGFGKLQQLSQRTMPKRPCSIAISDFDSNIICADKFGDVYSLPLKHTPCSSSSANSNSNSNSNSSTVSRPQTTPMTTTLKPREPAASTLTVHSKRNLEALKNQAKQLSQQQQQKRKENEESDETKKYPGFHLTLLLGHVSMLTSLLLPKEESNKGGRYIVTADRDEHIRISRYPPHSHVIEAFCLGHTDFVNALVIPASRPDLLISGGGDHHLMMWDWKSGTLLSQTNILSLARQIAPEIEKVAVSALLSFSWPSDSETTTYILAICEDINAIFTWHLPKTNTLTRPGAIQLAAPPLDLSVVPGSDGAPPRLIVAVNPDQSTTAKSLQAFRLVVDDGRLAVHSDFVFFDAALEPDETDASPAEIRQLLYTVENLRKQTGESESANAADAALSET